MSYKKQIELSRAGKDQFFKTSHQSPIPHDLRNKFFSLDYYPIDEKFVFKLPLNSSDTPEVVEMEESTGGVREFLRIGYLTFNIDEEESNIHVYQSTQNPNHYFVPFRDKTSGVETYGAGRYMDIEKVGELFELDFNKAYSPYCAYSENYSCPLPPFENWLKIAIQSGEKDFLLKSK
ncbi:MAG: DUF1684 domain-containing protein [Candidatus Kariarchaeaceae archaeon]|jgi:uncharacterized protein (DUF1684 family)